MRSDAEEEKKKKKEKMNENANNIRNHKLLERVRKKEYIVETLCGEHFNSSSFRLLHIIIFII